MSQLSLIFSQARLAGIIFVIVVLLGLGSVVLVSQLTSTANAKLVLRQSELQSAKDAIVALTSDLESIETHLTGFKHLSERGLVGTPNRERWIESLDALHRQSGLPPTLRFTLNTPKAHGDGQTELANAQALDHDLLIELTGIHEAEFLNFADRLNSEWMAPFRIEQCEMARSYEQGLKIACTVRLFSIPLPPTAESAQ